MERFDVLVVGGGPAGSSAARGLADAGAAVCVLDRAVFPRDKTCAGWITPPVFAALGVDPAEYAEGRTLQPIQGFRVRRIGDPESRAAFGETVSYGIRRCELDHFLLARSKATLRTGTKLGSLERVDGVWRVNGALEAPLLVGAGGHFCPVARRLTGDAPGAPVIAAQELEFPVADAEADAFDVEPALPELYFSPDLQGYGWVFRKGRYLNVGLGRRAPQKLGGELRAFLAWLAREGKLPPTLPDVVHGHAYLLRGEAERPLVADGVALVGDAAGLAWPKSGEGIRPAVESGLLLAEAPRRARSPADPAALYAYAGAVRARFGPDVAPRAFEDRLPAAWRRRLAGRLFAWPWFAREVVVRRWFLHTELPPLTPPSHGSG
jgi:flavin-dependent dehydrogenase